MARRKIECSKYKCTEPPFLGGLCEKHHEEYAKRKERRDTAIIALHTSIIKGSPLQNEELKTEFLSVQSWWNKACFSVNNDIIDEVLLDEAEPALEWCIKITQEIVDEELRYRKNDASEYESKISSETRKSVWRRFHYLEAGMRSNGLPRS